jgi:hypothetical protein
MLDMPCLLGFAGLTGAVDSVTTTTANGAQTIRGKDGSLFHYALNPLPSQDTTHMPPSIAYVPGAWFWNKSNSWKSEGDFYFKTAGKVLEPSPTATAKAREILGDKFTPEEAVDKLAAFVRDSLTYQGIAFGVRAMVPNTCDDILHNRYGDCKDHSFLLAQMLNGVGVRAYLTLADTTRNVNVATPDDFQFDHMIVYVPDVRGGLYIDTTEKGASYHDQPFWLAGSPVLILDKENGSRIATIPLNKPNADRLHVERRVTLSADGSATIREKLSFSGSWACFARETLRNKTPDQYAMILTEQFHITQIHSAHDVTAVNLESPDKEVVVEYSYRQEGVFAPIDGRLVGCLPQSWEMNELTPPGDQPVRRVPIWHALQTGMTSETILELPQGYAPEFPVRGDDAFDTPFFRVSVTLTAPDAATLCSRTDYFRKPGLFPADSRDARDQAYERVLNDLNRPIVLVKKPVSGQ